MLASTIVPSAIVLTCRTRLDSTPAAAMSELGTGNEPIERFGQTARKDGVLGQYSLASNEGLEFALASGRQSLRPFRKGTQFAYPLKEAAPEGLLKFGSNRLERGKRALRRD